MNEFVVIFRDEGDNLDWGRVSAGSLSEARKYGREFGAVKLIFPLSDLTNILHGQDPQSGRVDADVFNFVHEVSSSIKPSAMIASSASSSYAGFWISPSYEVFSVSGVTHVQFIWDNQELFGVSSKGKDFQYIQEGVVDDVVGSGWVRVRVTNCVYISISASSKLPRRLSEVANILINENVPSGFYAGVNVFNKDGTYRHFNERLSVLLSEDSQMLSSSIKPMVIRISSSVNSEHISKAVTTVKRFLDNVGAWYKHHKSKKSGSEYFLVERPDDRLSPEVDVRVSDHNLPYRYGQPDLDVDPDSPARSGSYSVPEALDLLEGFFDGDYSNIVDGEPIGASRKPYTPLYSGRSGGINKSVGFVYKSIFNSREMLSGGVWIDPSGDIFGVPLTHIKAVVDDPERFGLSVGQLKSIFRKHNEGLGSEGDARDEVIALLVSKGWVRIRYFPGESFCVELSKLTPDYKSFLGLWAFKVLSKHPDKASLGVDVYERQTNFSGTGYHFSLQQVRNFYNPVHQSRIMQIDNSIASWISPDGEFIGTHGSHTSTVMENPERFGLTKEEADSLFSQGEEEAIITHLLKRGWIRIRNQFNFILISIGALTSTVKRHLSEWSYEVSKDEDFPVILDISVSGKSQRLLLRDLRNGVFSGKRFTLDGQIKDEYALWSVLKSYTPLHSRHNGRIISSVVPKVNVGNPVIQKMVDEVSAVLRGVDDKYFPRIKYENALVRGDQYILFFVAEGRGFKVGVVCGSDGFISRVLFVLNDGTRIGAFDVSSPDRIRIMLDRVGIKIGGHFA